MSKPDFKELWGIDCNFTFLNHGSFGACPKYILDKQNEYRKMLESQPLRFMIRELEELLSATKQKLAEFLNADKDDIAFIPNATHGVNTILKSLDFKEGDEIITTNHEYFACRNAADFIAKKSGAKVIISEIPFPLCGNENILEILKQKITDRTKLLLIDYITSPTGLILPIPEIVEEFNSIGIDTLVDGAHSPGMISLDLKKLNAAYFTGNCHKWLCTPKGSALLFVRKDKQEKIHPLSCSHIYNEKISSSLSPFQTEFYWTGTYDPSPYLCIKDSIEYFSGLFENGWDEIRKINHELVLNAGHMLCDSFNIPFPAPENMIGSMYSFSLPDSDYKGNMKRNFIDPLQDTLFHKFKIEAMISYWPAFPKRVMRISAQLYNTIDDYNYLLKALTEIL